jgi:hypothetical protein
MWGSGDIAAPLFISEVECSLVLRVRMGLYYQPTMVDEYGAFFKEKYRKK